MKEVIVDFSSVGSGVHFNHNHFESIGIIFTRSSEFTGLVQGDEALMASTDISSRGEIAADIPQGFSRISVSFAAAALGSWEFLLEAIGKTYTEATPLVYQETGKTGYHRVGSSHLPDAVSFKLRGIKDGEPAQYGVNVIRFTPIGSYEPVSPLYIANRNSMEIHKSDCFWVTQMKDANKCMWSAKVGQCGPLK